MKKTFVFSLLSLVLLAGCTPRQGVEVVKGTPTTQAKSVEVKEQGVTAVCFDGTYSKEPVEKACQGHGGVVKVVAHYFEG